MALGLLGLVGSFLASGIGAIGSNIATNKAYKGLLNSEASTRNRYNSLLGMDWTKMTENQAIATALQDVAERNYRSSRAANTVAGGTDQSLALAQKQSGNMVSQGMSDMAAKASAGRLGMEERALQSQQAYDKAKIDVLNRKAQNISNAAGQATKAFAGILANPDAATTSIYDIFGIEKKDKSKA